MRQKQKNDELLIQNNGIQVILKMWVDFNIEKQNLIDEQQNVMIRYARTIKRLKLKLDKSRRENTGLLNNLNQSKYSSYINYKESAAVLKKYGIQGK